jgi:hypothetical protein
MMAQLLRGIGKGRFGTRGLSREVALLRQAAHVQLSRNGETIVQPIIIHSLQQQAFAISSLWGNFPDMERGRLKNALTRIEAAASRIEEAARRPGLAQEHTMDPALAHSHEKLRSEVGSTLQQLDALIDRLEA